MKLYIPSGTYNCSYICIYVYILVTYMQSIKHMWIMTFTFSNIFFSAKCIYSCMTTYTKQIMYEYNFGLKYISVVVRHDNNDNSTWTLSLLFLEILLNIIKFMHLPIYNTHKHTTNHFELQIPACISHFHLHNWFYMIVFWTRRVVHGNFFPDLR